MFVLADFNKILISYILVRFNRGYFCFSHGLCESDIVMVTQSRFLFELLFDAVELPD